MNSKNKKEISEKYKRLGLRSSSSSMEKREETPENYPKMKMREDRHSPKKKREKIKPVRTRRSSSPTMKIRENKDGENKKLYYNPTFGYSSSPTMKMREDKIPRRTRRSRSSSPKRKKRESPRRTPSPPNLLENKMFEQEDELGFERYKRLHKNFPSEYYWRDLYYGAEDAHYSQIQKLESEKLIKRWEGRKKLMTKLRLGEILLYVDYKCNDFEERVYKKGYYTKKDKEHILKFLKLGQDSIKQYQDDHSILFDIKCRVLNYQGQNLNYDPQLLMSFNGTLKDGMRNIEKRVEKILNEYKEK
jgi:hypothetical protein